MRFIFLATLAVALCSGCQTVRTGTSYEPVPLSEEVFLLLDRELESIFSASPPASNQEVLERINHRLQRTEASKRAQLVGETNVGLLEARRELTASQRELVRDENRDRRIIYDAIADRHGLTWQHVGTVRARQIAARGAGGIWFQNEHGEWYEN